MSDQRTIEPKELPETQVAAAEAPTETRNFLGFKSLRGLMTLAVAILAIRSVVLSPYHVPTESMEPTIKVGDRLMAFKAAYNLRLPFTNFVLINFAAPTRGEIVIFRDLNKEAVDYVKRVVAVAGDEIEIRQDQIYVNGQAQILTPHDHDRSILADTEEPASKRLFKEQFADQEHWITLGQEDNRPLGLSSYPADQSKKFTVPEGSVFVLGDNRDKSTDSRYWGEVPLSYVKGRALFVIWSIFDPGNESWPEVRWGRIGHWLE